jgi:hypothetical protein
MCVSVCVCARVRRRDLGRATYVKLMGTGNPVPYVTSVLTRGAANVPRSGSSLRNLNLIPVLRAFDRWRRVSEA